MVKSNASAEYCGHGVSNVPSDLNTIELSLCLKSPSDTLLYVLFARQTSTSLRALCAFSANFASKCTDKRGTKRCREAISRTNSQLIIPLFLNSTVELAVRGNLLHDNSTQLRGMYISAW